MKRHLIEVWGGIQYSLIHETTTPSTSGVNVSTSVFDAKLDIMNIHTDFWIHQTFLTHSIISNSMFARGPESCQLMLYNAPDLQHDGFTW